MNQGGKRTGAGRKKVERPVDGNVARKIKARVKAEELWVFLVATARAKAELTNHTADLRQALEYLDNRDLGNTTDNVNHIHDKPIDLNVTVSMAEIVRKVRQRKQEYERSRK